MNRKHFQNDFQFTKKFKLNFILSTSSGRALHQCKTNCAFKWRQLPAALHRGTINLFIFHSVLVLFCFTVHQANTNLFLVYYFICIKLFPLFLPSDLSILYFILFSTFPIFLFYALSCLLYNDGYVVKPTARTQTHLAIKSKPKIRLFDFHRKLRHTHALSIKITCWNHPLHRNIV